MFLLDKQKITESIVGVGLCSTRYERFSGGVEPRPYSSQSESYVIVLEVSVLLSC